MRTLLEHAEDVGSAGPASVVAALALVAGTLLVLWLLGVAVASLAGVVARARGRVDRLRVWRHTTVTGRLLGVALGVTTLAAPGAGAQPSDDGTAVLAPLDDEAGRGTAALTPLDGPPGAIADDPLPRSDAATETTPAGAGTWVTAVAGDHLWGLAERALDDELGRPPTDHEIAERLGQVIDWNRSSLVDPANPDLIHPGQRFRVR